VPGRPGPTTRRRARTTAGADLESRDQQPLAVTGLAAQDEAARKQRSETPKPGKHERTFVRSSVFRSRWLIGVSLSPVDRRFALAG